MMKKYLSALMALCLLALSVPALAGSGEFFGPFSAEQLNGEGEITMEYFEEPYITLVNFWATWCGPCINELPDLQKIEEMTGGKVVVLGVQMDSLDLRGLRDESAIKAMEKLLENAGVTYPVVMPDAYMIENLFGDIQYIPTTYIVDFEGEIYDTVVGSHTAEEWVEIANKAIDAIYE